MECVSCPMRWLVLFALVTACGDDATPIMDASLPDSGMDASMDSDTFDVGQGDAGEDAPAVDATVPMDVPAACTTTAVSETRDITYSGADREYVLHIPATATASNALVFDLHGFTESPNRQNGRSNMRAKADEEGFVLVQPQGQSASWNGGACCGSASQDDVGFLRAIAAEIATTACIDPGRIYVTGMSNGGFLAHRAACEASDFFAAIAPVAGVLGIDEDACNPTTPIPVMHFHGRSDLIVPYNGNVFLSYPSVDDTISFWRGANSCDAESTRTYDEGNTECDTWSCAGGTEVTVCSTSGFGHDWPEGGSDINATDAMWEFFQRHRR